MMDKNLIFYGIYGSHLYGLNTPASDTDYKGIYLPTKEELIFSNYPDVIETVTREEDISLFALPKWFKILSKCDTVSMDMLHTPEKFTQISSPMWEKIKSHRQDLYCKNMRGLIGYIKTQASKYGHKIVRYKEMNLLLDFLATYPSSVKLSKTTISSFLLNNDFKYISLNKGDGVVKENVDVCGSRYQTDAQVSYILKGISVKLSKYGKRTKQGDSKGLDAKSLSHALRVLYQIEEMVDARDLQFPLKKKNIILSVKLGEINEERVSSMIEDKFDEVMEKLSNCDLPEKPNMENIKNVIMEEVL